jgi:hypothetical protein
MSASSATYQYIAALGYASWTWNRGAFSWCMNSIYGTSYSLEIR